MPSEGRISADTDTATHLHRVISYNYVGLFSILPYTLFCFFTKMVNNIFKFHCGHGVVFSCVW